MFFQNFAAESVLVRHAFVTVQCSHFHNLESRRAARALDLRVMCAAVSILYLCGSGSESGNESMSVANPDSDQDPDSNPAHLMYCI